MILPSLRRGALGLSLFVLGAVAACEQKTTLPPAPVLKPGEGFTNAASFDTGKMLKMCEQSNAVAAAGTLSSFTDVEVANGVCELSAVTVVIISREADPQQTCVAATVAMGREFKRRFPDHDPAEVIGRC